MRRLRSPDQPSTAPRTAGARTLAENGSHSSDRGLDGVRFRAFALPGGWRPAMTPSDAAQRYALALPGVWLIQNDGSFAHLGGRYASPAHRDWAQNVLQESWGVDGKPAILESLNWLHQKGHSSEWFEWQAKWASLPADQRETDLRLMHVGIFQAEIGKTGLVAWDQARCINVAGWGFLAGYLTEEEAWDHIIPAAQKIQRAYPSFEAYGRAYGVGAAFWSAPAADRAKAASQALLADPASAWNTVPWTTPIGAGSAAASESSGGGSGWLMYAVGCVGLVVVGGLAASAVLGLVVLAGAGFLTYRTTSSSPTAGGSGSAPVAVASGDWDGSAPFVCKGNEAVTLAGMTVKLDNGPAVLAKGNCALILDGMTIEAPVAVRAEGNAEITVNGGKLSGSKAAVEAAANSKVHLKGTTLDGKVDRKGGAKVDGP